MNDLYTAILESNLSADNKITLLKMLSKPEATKQPTLENPFKDLDKWHRENPYITPYKPMEIWYGGMPDYANAGMPTQVRQASFKDAKPNTKHFI